MTKKHVGLLLKNQSLKLVLRSPLAATGGLARNNWEVQKYKEIIVGKYETYRGWKRIYIDIYIYVI